MRFFDWIFHRRIKDHNRLLAVAKDEQERIDIILNDLRETDRRLNRELIITDTLLRKHIGEHR